MCFIVVLFWIISLVGGLVKRIDRDFFKISMKRGFLYR